MLAHVTLDKEDRLLRIDPGGQQGVGHGDGVVAELTRALSAASAHAD